ncbi:uncharacterized protein LOC132723432 [Ruditapes philippinarum]|uniref:uncharacterized protein LOC132723432 n=1 Tax=Ruditapes philippinarum TaxID=129788 RepID=UPI00295A69A4|nr:uncharacterized protein LOC132723432 [Ruditapes philippinarum]
MLQQDEEKSKNKQKAESADSYGKDYDNAFESGSRFNNTKNLWIPGSNNRLDIQKEWQDKGITSSGRTNHSYADINALPIPNTTKPRKQSNRCRIIQVVGVVLVLAVLEVITFFIVRNFSSKAEEVVCGLNEMKEPSGSCKPVVCEDNPVVQNGLVNVLKKAINSTAKLQCNPGFMANTNVNFQCMTNGSWVSDSEAACFLHPCGPYSLSDNVIVSEDLSHINMSITLRCAEGFDFKNESENQIQCVNNTWIGTPVCEIPGILTTETTSSPVNVGDSFDILCRLRESSSWQTVMVFRSGHSNDSVPNQLFSISYNHTSGIRYGATTFRENVSTFRDGVHLRLTFDTANCDDTGVYTCAVIVGDIQVPTDQKNTSTEIKVIETASKIKEIIASASYVQGDDANVVCKGLIGKDENEKKLGDISVRIYWDEETSKDINSVIDSTHSSGCQVDEIVNASFVITNDMHGAELQCIARGDDGSRDKKSILLNVTTTKIQISSSASTVDIGEYFSISTQLTYIRGWSTLELRKNCSGTEITIVSIQKNDTLSNLTIEEHIDLIDSDINNTTARLTFQFRNVTCSDACKKGGDIVYISTVKIDDSWVMESERIEFKMNPSVPVLTLGQDKFYKGQEATLKCTGNIGIPTHIMSITEDNVVLKLPPSSSEIYLNPETCENVETISHEFEVKDEMEGRRYQCVTSFTNGTKLSSNVEILNVTDPILYFTEESKTGTVGNTKSIQCILTETTNLSYVVVSRFSTEETLCEVNTTGKGTCNNKAEFSVHGTLSENSGVFTTTLTIHNVSCNNKVMYSCKAIGINTLKTSMDFKVIAAPTIPNLRLPTTIVEEQMSEWEDLFKCDAFLGYPANNRRLKIENKAKGSDSFKDYITQTFENGDCDGASSIERTQHMFPRTMNGSTIRCVVTDENNNILTSSAEKELRILKNVCLDEGTGQFDPHPYNCRRFIRCVGNRLYDLECASGSCSLWDSDPICNSKYCSSC